MREELTPLMWCRRRFILGMLERHLGKGKGSCLEIGCGRGDLLAALEGKGFTRVKGIDLSEKNVELAKSRGLKAEVSRADLFDLREKFDVVMMLEVLEHIEDDGKAVAFIADNLISPGGFFVLSVPSHNSLKDLDFGHYRYYRREELRKLLERSGLKVLSFYSHGPKVIDSLGVMLLKRRYSVKPGAGTRAALTEESGRIEFPFIWKRILYPVLSKFYMLFYMIDYALRKTDMGVDYLVLCRKA